MKKRSSRQIISFIFIIWFVSCTRLPSHVTISPSNPPGATPTVFSTEQIATIGPTQRQTKTPTLTNVPGQTPTSPPSGKVVIWAPIRIKDLLDQPSLMDGFKKRYPGIDLQWVAKDAPKIENDVSQPGDDTRVADVIYLEGDLAASVAASGALSEAKLSASGTNYSGIAAAATDLSLNNHVYALALFTEPIVVYYRRDIFEKAGLANDPSEVAKLMPSWQALLSTCKIIHTKIGFPCFDQNRANNSGDLYEVMLQTQNSGYYDEAGKLRISSEKLVPVLSDLYGYWKAGVVGDELAWTPAWLDHLASDDNPVALVFGTPGLGKALETWIAPMSVGKWGIVPLPSYGHDPSFGARGPGGYLAITAGSKNQAASLEVIRFFTRDLSIQTALLEWKEYFPAFINPSDTSTWKRPDPFFAGQIPSEIFSASSNFPERSIYGPDYHEIHSLIVSAIRQVATGRMQPLPAINRMMEQQKTPTPQS